MYYHLNEPDTMDEFTAYLYDKVRSLEKHIDELQLAVQEQQREIEILEHLGDDLVIEILKQETTESNTDALQAWDNFVDDGIEPE